MIGDPSVFRGVASASCTRSRDCASPCGRRLEKKAREAVEKAARAAARAASKAKKEAPVQTNTMLNYGVARKVGSIFMSIDVSCNTWVHCAI